MNLHDWLDQDELSKDIHEGYISMRNHDTLPLTVFNYTAKCQYERYWTPETLACRGLIVDNITAEVIARPFPKFFNYDEVTLGQLMDLGESEPTITLKMDGCFLGDTKLNVWGGGTIPIRKVVRDRLPVTLIGMNAQGELVPAKVIDWHHNGRKDTWIDITVSSRVSRTSGARGCPNKIRITPNHSVCVNGSFQSASCIQVGDVLVTQDYEPSESVFNIIRASLLGDGCIVPSLTNSSVGNYQEPHSIKQEEYVLALQKALGDCATKQRTTVSGYGSTLVWVSSKQYRALGDLRRTWYPHGVKVVPEDLSWMDDFAVAKWLMDDGSLSHTEVQVDRLHFSTNGFTFPDVQRLANKLHEMYGVSCTVYESKGANLRVNVGRNQEIDILWEKVAPYIHPSLRYKLPAKWRNMPYQPFEVGYEKVIPYPSTVVSVDQVDVTDRKRNFPSGRTGFDVTTTTGNYLAKGILVHNSLGIMYQGPGGLPRIATRGSFHSDQAMWATAWLTSNYPSYFPPPNMTLLFEIIYPANRIVVDYGATEELFLLAVIDNETGADLPLDAANWPGLTVAQMDSYSYADLLRVLPDLSHNEEGFVCQWNQPNLPAFRVKMKGAEYLRLHRLVTGCSNLTVWEHLKEARPFDELLDRVPDEFNKWLKAEISKQTWDHDMLVTSAMKRFNAIMDMVEFGNRKAFAEYATKQDHSDLLFALYDGKSIEERAWKKLRPVYARPYTTEDDS